jgi:hypothetical protein
VDRIVLFLVSWFAGLVAYFGALYLRYGEVPATVSGDFAAVLFWSVVAFAIAYVALYLPVLGWIARRRGGTRPLWPFAVAAVAAGIVPTALILVANGGGLHALASPEAQLFYVMFVTIGIVVGIGYALLGLGPRTPGAG